MKEQDWQNCLRLSLKLEDYSCLQSSAIHQSLYVIVCSREAINRLYAAVPGVKGTWKKQVGSLM